MRTVKVEEPAESFFNFFSPPEAPEDGGEEMEPEEAEELNEQLEQDYELGALIKDKVIPRAVAWFTGAAVNPEDEYDDDDEDGDDDDDDEIGRAHV